MSDQTPFRLPLPGQRSLSSSALLLGSTAAASFPTTPALNSLASSVESSSTASTIFGGSSFSKPKETSSVVIETSTLFGGPSGFGTQGAVFGNTITAAPSVFGRSGSTDGILKSDSFISSSFKAEEPQMITKPMTFGGPSQLMPGIKPNIFGGSSIKPSESSDTMKPSVFGALSQVEEPSPSVIRLFDDSPKSSVSRNASQQVLGPTSNVFVSDTRTVFNQPSNAGDPTSALNASKVTFVQPSQQEICSSTFLAKQESPFQQPSIFGGSGHQNLFTIPPVPFASQSSPVSPRRGTVLSINSAELFSSSSPDTSKHSTFLSECKQGNTVSSSMPHNLGERSVNSSVESEVEDKIECQSGLEIEPQKCTSDWEPDSVSEENHTPSQNKERNDRRSIKSSSRRSVFAKALGDVSQLSAGEQYSEELKSVYCRPVDGKLPERDVIKAHFSQYGVISRLTISLQHQYCTVSYKTHEEASRAIKECSHVGETKVHLFWRNVSKLKRCAEEDTVAKAKIKDSASKRSRGTTKEPNLGLGIGLNKPRGSNSVLSSFTKNTFRSDIDPPMRVKEDIHNMEMDTEVQEELAALSELDYQSHETRILSDGDTTKTKSKALKTRLGRSAKDKRSVEKSPDVGKSKKSRTKRVGKTDDSGGGSQNIEKDGPDSFASGPSSMISTTGATELIALMKMPALSSEEKLTVLEARDKLIRLRLVKQCDLSKAVKTVGTCPDMCPEKERLLRETRRQVSQYEMTSLKMNPALMVKQYSRSSADQEEPLPHELRPPHVLTMTMNYLLHCIMDLCDHPGENLAEWFHFLWDRTRGIRKEITQQELCDLDTVSLVEQCARFHIHCCARLVAEDLSVFDDRINTENLTKCLQTLKHMYHDLWIKSSVTCPNEPEFITYFILLNLNNGTIMWEMEQLREEVLTSPGITFATSLYSSLSSNNFVRFFRLVRKASYLNSCLCIRYFYQVRSRALRTYVKALAKLRPIQFPLSSLVENLGFENVERAAAFCIHHGLQVEESPSDTSCVVLSAGAFHIPDNILPRERAYQLVEVKKKESAGEIVYGGSLPARSFELHVPHNSFDSNGLLRANAYAAKDQGLMSGEKEDLFIEETDHDGSNKSQNVIHLDNAKENNVVALTLESVTQNPPKPPEIQTTTTKVFLAANSHSSSERNGGLTSSAPFITSFAKTESNPFTSNTFINPIGSLVRQSHIILKSSEMDVVKPEAKEKHTTLVSEDDINAASSEYMNDILGSVIQEGIKDVANAVLENVKAEEKEAKEQELRERILQSHIERVSKEIMSDLLEEILPQLIADAANEAEKEEKLFLKEVEFNAESFLESFISEVLEEESRVAAVEAREGALQCLVADCFYHWLSCARRSLRMKYAMEDFPAGVSPLSIVEHAERWGLPNEHQLSVWKGQYGRHERAIDPPELKASPSFNLTTLADLIGVQVLHRYDTMRPKLGLHSTDHLLYKLLISTPDQANDPASHLVEWWIRRAFKQNNCMLYDDVKMGIFRLVSGQKVSSEVAVYASLQMVKGGNILEKYPSLVSGTSAILFSVSPCSSIVDSGLRLKYLLQALSKLPSMPLVVVVISPTEPPLDGLKQLVVELRLDYWLKLGVICDYQILHVEDKADVEKISNRIKPALNYMTMTWTPTPQVDLVFLKNIIMSTFQMFYISIQFNYNSSEVYPQDVNDPKLIIGLCNEWLDSMCDEFLFALQEAKDLYGEEFWPLLHKGTFLPFYKNPHYEHYLKKIIMSIKLPEIANWPPSSESVFDDWFTAYTSWLRPDDLKLTTRRLSCLKDLPFSEKLKNIPWIHLVEGWMEARMRYANTTELNNVEFMCLIRPQNIEQLYAEAWWSHSKHIASYLESHSTGKELEMDLDETVSYSASDRTSDVTCNSPMLNKSTASTQLLEVSNCVTELKAVNESLGTRLREALHDSTALGSSDCSDVPCKVPDISSEQKYKSPSDVMSLLKSISSQIQIQHNVNSNMNLLLSSALSAGNCDEKLYELRVGKSPHAIFNDSIPDSHEQMSYDQSIEEKDKEEMSFPKDDSADKMAEIMRSMNQIMSSLEEKHRISEKKKKDRLTGLKIGTEVALSNINPFAPEILQRSAFVEQREQLMKDRDYRSCLHNKDDYGGDEKHKFKKNLSRRNSDSEDNESELSYSKSFSSPSSHDTDASEGSTISSRSSGITEDELEEAKIISSDNSELQSQLNHISDTKEINSASSQKHSTDIDQSEDFVMEDEESLLVSNVVSEGKQGNEYELDELEEEEVEEMEEGGGEEVVDNEEEEEEALEEEAEEEALEEEAEEEALEEEAEEEEVFEEGVEEDEAEEESFEVLQGSQAYDQNKFSCHSHVNRFGLNSSGEGEIFNCDSDRLERESADDDIEEVSSDGGHDSQEYHTEKHAKEIAALETGHTRLSREKTEEDSCNDVRSSSESESQSSVQDVYSGESDSQQDDLEEVEDSESDSVRESQSDDCEVID